MVNEKDEEADLLKAQLESKATQIKKILEEASKLVEAIDALYQEDLEAAEEVGDWELEDQISNKMVGGHRRVFSAQELGIEYHEYGGLYHEGTWFWSGS